jgi:UDP-galactopyranose mutase
MAARRTLIVGAGFAGSVVARRLADSGRSVLLIDERPHIAGNAYDRLDGAGVRIHQYGPHIFHTNSRAVLDFLSRFTGWRDYEHRSLSRVGDKLVPFPVNIATLNALFGLDLDEGSAEDFLNSIRRPLAKIRNGEDVIVDRMGTAVYEQLFKGYAERFWGFPPSRLSPSVMRRVPVRLTFDARYFLDTYQRMPSKGFSHMFENMLDHPAIDLALDTPFCDVDAKPGAFEHIVYTGPISEYFGERFGPLPYRSIAFELVHHEGVAFTQSVGTINYPGNAPWTRVSEFKHLTGQYHSGTTIVREYPTDKGPPFYPIPTAENRRLYLNYRALAQAETGVSFVGRLAEYRYYNMDQVVGSALKLSRALIGRHSA